MPDISTIGTWLLGSGGLITGGLSLYSIRSSRNKTDSETGVNSATKKKLETEAATLSEESEIKREEFWNKKFDAQEEKFEAEIQELREELAWMRILIENHVPWDWETQRLLIQNNIEHRKPPSLNYIKGKMKEKDNDG